jgi:hypothetical protein
MIELLLLAGAGLAAAAGLILAASGPAQPIAPPKVVHYRTQDGEAFYSFSIEEQPGGNFRSYIAAQPGYGYRSSDAHSTHRHWDGGRPYVCWSKPVTSEHDALRVSAAWADATQQYIKNGQRF